MEDAVRGQIGHHLAHGGSGLHVFGKTDDMHRHRAGLQRLAAIKIETGLPLVDQILWITVGEADGVGSFDFGP